MTDETWNLRVAMNLDGGIDVDALCARLASAERALVLQGRTCPSGHSASACDDDKAALQAWMEWHRAYGDLATPVDPETRLELAARRDVARNVTLMRIRRERRDEDGRP